MRTDKTESEYAELKQLLLETKKIAEDARSYSRSVKNYVRWMQIVNIARLLLIIIPLAIAFIYLPSLIRGFTTVYENFLGGTAQSSILKSFLNRSGQLNNVPIDEKGIQEILKLLENKR